MHIHVFGDSHARDFSALPGFVSHQYNGIGMYFVGSTGVPVRSQDFAPGSLGLFCFGAVEARVHLVRYAEEHGLSEEDAAQALVGPYVEKAVDLCRRRSLTPLIAAIIPAADTSLSNPEAAIPQAGSLADVIRRTTLLDAVLHDHAEVRLISFFDPYGPFRRPDGALNMELSDGIVHIADQWHGLVRDEFLKSYAAQYSVFLPTTG